MSTKHLSKSLTLQGAVVMAISFVMAKFDIQLSENELVQFADIVFMGVGSVMTVVGRLRAKHKLHVA